MKKIITALLFFCLSNILLAQPNISDVQPQGGGTSKSDACIGETIRITGSGFQSTGMTITINGGSIISTYSFLTPAAIELVIPPGTPSGGTGIVVTALSLASNARSLNVNPGTTIFAPPTDQTVCEGNPYNFSVSATGGGTMAYSWKKNTVTTGQTTTTISGSTLLADSGAIYTVDVINSTCNTVTTTSPVKLHVNRKPTNPPTLPNLNNCQNGIFTLNATPPNIGSGTWACQSNCAGISFNNINIPNTQVNGVPEGGAAPVLSWTVVNGVCSVPSAVTLLNYAMPTTTSVIAGADTNICTTSAPVTLTGNTPTGTFTNVDWSLQGPSTGTFGSPTVSYTTFTPTSGAGNYIVEYIIRNGACNSISTKQITVHDLPTSNAGSSYTACFGSPLSLNGIATGASSVFWSIGGGNGSFSGVSGLNPTYTPSGPDSLGITFAVALNVSNIGCSTPVSDTVTITIHIKPKAYIPSGSDATVCAGSSVLIPVNFIGTPPFSGIGLYNGVTNTDLGTVSGTTTSFSVSPTSNTNYTLAPVGTFMDALGCAGSWNGSSFITAAPGMAASINIVPGMICSGDNATLTINPSGGGGPGWKVYLNTGGPNTMINISGIYSTTISPSSTGTYTVDSIETVGCGKIKILGVNKTVVVNTPPTVSASMAINVADDTLCQGENTTVEITGVQLNTVYKLVKNYNSITLDSIVIGNTMPGSANVLLPISKFTAGKIDTIRFMARRPGCGVIPSVTTAYIWTSGLTNPVISASPTGTLCENKILLFTPQANVMYQWYESGKMIVGATASKDTAFFGGSYSVQAKDTLSCKLPSNNIDVNYAGNEPTISVTTVSSTETKLSTGSAANTYFWYAQTSTGIKKIQGANANSISVYFDGNYYLGTIANSCFFMSAPQTVSGKLGGSLLKQSFVENDSTIILPEMDFSSDARAYPNPISESNLTVDYIAGDVTKISFILYNSQGFPVVQKEIEGDGLIHTEIPTRGLPTGVYNLYINDGVKQVRKNIMIY